MTMNSSGSSFTSNREFDVIDGPRPPYLVASPDNSCADRAPIIFGAQKPLVIEAEEFNDPPSSRRPPGRHLVLMQ